MDNQNQNENKPEILTKETIEDKTNETSLTTTKIEGEPRSFKIYDIVDSGKPDEIVAKKHELAKVLQHVINTRPDGFEVNGKRCLAYEDWLFLSKMNQCVPRIRSTTYGVEKYGSMCFEAICDLVHVPSGTIVGTAEAMAEKMEKGKDWMTLNQIRSLAQTRAGSKVMRMAFADIAVLAGYTPTPVEEIDETSLVSKSVGTSKLKGLVIK